MSLFTRNALIALLITVAIIGTVLYAVNFLNQQRVAELRSIEDQLATDTLSIETQFALLEEAPCEDIAAGTISQEVGGVGDKLAYAEERAGANDPEVLRLKERYTLLQIRDYLLTKRLSETCGVNPVVALYFYSNVPGECEECDRAGYALSYLRQTYPALRVYSFDYHLDLAALRTFISVLKVHDGEFPAFVIQGKPSYGFTSLEDLEKAFPKSLFATSTTKASQ
ncbi:MAG TPA: hypothetical protein PK109_02540 [Candidatus Paceibacterota bacterium]|nr:hypothetical protein [Candidatus Paceibacterota bacterium]